MTDPLAPGPKSFHTTHWSLVAAANTEADETVARAALAELCRLYWYPLYAFVRHRGYSSDEAQDLTQAFFVRIIETLGFASANPERGRFRSYLLGALKNFLANEWHRTRTLKRGGGQTFVELDGLDPEARYALEPADSTNPEASFDREWALESTSRAMEGLRAEFAARGKIEVFDALKGSLTGAEIARRETSVRLGMSEGALKVTVHRLRQRYRELLRSEIAKTVADPSDVEDEMRHLVHALRGERGFGT